MHRIELAFEQSSKNFAVETTWIISAVTKHFQYGKDFVPFKELSEELYEVFLAPKIFKCMKFVAHAQQVFKSFIVDFEGYAAYLEKTNNVALRNGMLSSKFLI